MGLKAILEIAVLFERFWNIDLLHQGLYQLQISCYYYSNSEKIKAQPINFEQFGTVKTKSALHNIIQGSINEEELSIKTRVFFIRYADEKVKIDEVASFYIEIELNDSFSDLEVSKKSENDRNTAVSYEEILKLVDTIQFQISYPLKGLFEYLPINFKSQ